MAFDGIVTKSVITELKTIIGSKIDKIYEPDKNTIILGLYSQGKHYALTICIDARNCRIHLTTHSRINPLVAPNFCMLLRKHLIGGKISDISMIGLERLVNIEIETINEFNEIEKKILIVELMGKHSNIILVNKNNRIIDGLRHLDSSNNSYRNILPSQNYVLPSSDKLDFMEVKDFEDFFEKVMLDNSVDSNLSLKISNTFTGFSKSFVDLSIQKCKITSQNKEDLEKLYNYFLDILNHLDKLYFEKIYKNTKVSDYALVLDTTSKENFSLNFFLDDFYYERETVETFTNYRNSILKLILDILKKYNQRLLSINEKLKECDNMEKYKLYGELITSNLYRLNNQHVDSIQLENYYDNNSLITIPLDIKYSIQLNAKRYFKKYAKLKNAYEIVSQQKLETESELNYIESIVYELENCSNLEDVQSVFEEISENVVFRERVKKREKKQKVSKKKQHHSFTPLEYEIDGNKVYVGRNNRENDWLTFVFAKKDDIWFHTKDIHGSHVILKANGSVTTDTLVKCAQIAAKHSKANISSNVPVDYCLVKFVRKPNAAKPGMVIFSNNKTFNVNPQDFKE